MSVMTFLWKGRLSTVDYLCFDVGRDLASSKIKLITSKCFGPTSFFKLWSDNSGVYWSPFTKHPADN